MLGRTLLAATALAATAFTAPAALPGTDPEPPADPVAALRLTNDSAAPASNGTADATVGQSVQVRLDKLVENGLEYTYGEPKSSDEAVVAPDADGGDETGGDGITRFKAVSEGMADLVAEATCTPVEDDAVCPGTVDPWKVTVTVKAPRA
ncbi:hypothetical protein ACIQ6Y_32365 [Streptomyces sp. NPDC096205]|uniref:hypothetical protein n=1 Tax=Streptomyces sp. NPDC096205 TaxID=3366081 RepID=UPI0038177190